MEYIDLGLSVKWATCNLGASKPEGYGNYYAWGETEPKTEYSWYRYKWCKYRYDKLTKYCKDSEYGTVDNKTVLEPEDDAAHVNLGGSWRMPTMEEWEELIDNCTWERIEDNNGRSITGYIVRSKKEGYTDKSIFLPAAGYCDYTDRFAVGVDGYYWSSSLDADYSYDARSLNYVSGIVSSSGNRYYGQSIRPVYDENLKKSI